MATQEETTRFGARWSLQPLYVNVRVKMSALWTALLFVFVYLDVFSLYRPDVRAEIQAGEIGGFSIGEGFLLATTAYIVIPSLMVFGALVLRPRIDRIANGSLSVIYALTIVAGAIGEWNYFLLGSGVELALLAGILYYAWTWPRLVPPALGTEREVMPQQAQVSAP